ncbi:F0F1 ATP synthase subunit B' [Roseomonas sp. M0104]|uniref:ATP synthase subunit b n=2 Tax=Teichococcus coralli TaxID=2545983 RepID=A0A845BGB9_9PROT|nr:F0F1 ATP synthase subunit B' [Pseudoroseomonas coralli]
MQMMKPMPLAGMLALLATSAAHAVETAGGAMEETTTGGMPQLDFSNPLMLAQVVWMLIIFGVLYYVLANVALPRVTSVLDERRHRIEGDLEAARAAKAEADAAAGAYQSATAKARADSQAAIAGALQSAQAEASAKNEVLNARLAEQIEAAEARIATARDTAMAALREVATDTANAMVTRLTGLKQEAATAAAVQRQLAAQGKA